MTELRDLSRLPDDAAYWANLEARILADVGKPASAGRESEPLGPLAARAWSLSGFAAAATIAALLLLPSRSSSPGGERPGLLKASQDNQAILDFVTAPAPPGVISLVMQISEDVR
jgi:hypothetical protein